MDKFRTLYGERKMYSPKLLESMTEIAAVLGSTVARLSAKCNDRRCDRMRDV